MLIEKSKCNWKGDLHVESEDERGKQQRLSVTKDLPHQSRIHVHDCKAMLNTLSAGECMRLTESLSSTSEMALTLVSI